MDIIINTMKYSSDRIEYKKQFYKLTHKSFVIIKFNNVNLTLLGIAERPQTPAIIHYFNGAWCKRRDKGNL